MKCNADVNRFNASIMLYYVFKNILIYYMNEEIGVSKYNFKNITHYFH
jgi:hypothetical protein